MYTQTKWSGLYQRKRKTTKFVPVWHELLNQNKNKEALKPYKKEMARTKTPKVPLKLHYGSRLHLKSLQKWLENWYRNQLAIEPPKSIGMSTKRKTIRVSYEDTRWRTSNNTIKTHVTSSQSYILHKRWEKTQEYHNEVRSTYATNK